MTLRFVYIVTSFHVMNTKSSAWFFFLVIFEYAEGRGKEGKRKYGRGRDSHFLNHLTSIFGGELGII